MNERREHTFIADEDDDRESYRREITRRLMPGLYHDYWEIKVVNYTESDEEVMETKTFSFFDDAADDYFYHYEL